MPHSNRNRLTVTLGDGWRLYTTTLPAGATPLGVVTRSDGTAGALVRIERTGLYVQVNAGVLRRLDGRKVAAALGTAGRPATVSGRRVQVYLDDDTIRRAKEIGGGNVSAGIRRAVMAAPEQD